MTTWKMDEHHEKILTEAAEAWDMEQKARAILKKKGFTMEDRFKQERPRPEVQIARDNALLFQRSLRELGLDEIAPRPPHRPSGKGGTPKGGKK